MADFIDIVYSYAIYSPENSAMMRSAIIGYAFDIQSSRPEVMTFEGFKDTSMSMLDELDNFS